MANYLSFQSIKAEFDGIVLADGGFSIEDNAFYRSVYDHGWDANRDLLLYSSFKYNNDDVPAFPSENRFESQDKTPKPNEFGNINTAVMIGNNNDTVFYDSLYAPKEMRWNLHNTNDTSIAPNIQIIWNQDLANLKGVVIKVSFLPNFNMHSNTLRQADNVTNYIHVIDDGSYTLSNSAFTNIPDSCIVLLTLARGNFKMINSTNSTKKFKWEIITRQDDLFYYY